jgi:HEAT repeat protein
MPIKAHQSIRDYVEAIRPIVDRADAFGVYVMRMMHRESRMNANGLFQRVREVYEAVLACGGTSAEAREWTFQSFLWWSQGKAVERKFAKFELDQRATRAMDQLLKLLQLMPDELIQVTPPAQPSFFRSNNNPFGVAPNPFANKPAAPATPPASAKPTSPFGSKPSAPAATPPSRSPFGQPAPTPPKPSPFGSRASAAAVPALPYHLAMCFDALDVAPTASKTGPVFPPSPHVEEKAEEPLPTDLHGLLDRWISVATEAEEAMPILRKIGELDDLHALDYIHNLTGDGSTEINLIDTYKHIGGNVGIAGLLSLLPLTAETRSIWLEAVCTVTQQAMQGGRPLNEVTLDTIWTIAVAESAPNVVFCAESLNLLAATGRNESLHILWTHARADDVDRRRVALYAIAQLDPGDTLGELLTAINALPPLLPPTTPRNPFQAATPVEMPVTYVGIPFERLEAMVRHGKLKQSVIALRLLSYHNDERVIPFLISQLSRRLFPLRDGALTHLRRLKATTAADAVARAMTKEADLCLQAGEALCEWGDPRCVPVLLPHMISGDAPVAPQNVIRKFDALKYDDYADWLLKTVETLKKYETEEADTLLTQMVNLLVEIKSPYLEDVLRMLISSPSQRVRYAVVMALPKSTEDWINEAICKLVLDSSPVVSYRAILMCRDPEMREYLTASRNELHRLLGIRMLWLEKDIEALRAFLADESAAVHDAAAWALAHLGTETVVDDLRQLVEKEDRIDAWHQNPAVIAWTGLARMGALQVG